MSQPGARVLLLGEARSARSALLALGLRAEEQAEATAAVQAVLAADIAFDPYVLVVGADPALARTIDNAPLIAAPQLLPMLPQGEGLQAALAPLLALPGAAPGAHIAIEGIDVAAGLAHVGGDRAFYLKLMERFAADQRNTLAGLRSAQAAGDMAQVRHLAHKLRGSAASIGATPLRDEAAALEAAPGEGASVAVATSLSTLLSALDTFLEANWGQTPKSFSATGDSAQMVLQLIAMLEQFDGEALDFFERARMQLAGAFAADTLSLIASHLQRYEFDAARALLETK